MTNNQFVEYQHIPKEKFEFANQGERIHDKKLDTKPIGYFKDAWIRFRRNKSSVAATLIIIVLVLFAIIVPMVSPYTIADRNGYYANRLPKNSLTAELGFWDGAKTETKNAAGYDYYAAIGVESGKSAIIGDVTERLDADGRPWYTFRLDTYAEVGYAFQNLSEADYLALQEYQNETGIQVMYPIPKTYKTQYVLGNGGANFWYKLVDETQGSAGAAVRDENGDYIPNYMTSDSPNKAKYDSLRIEGDNGGANGDEWYVYARKVQGGNYQVRVNYEEFYKYTYDRSPVFLFGTNAYGQDILTCLAAGARLSFLLAVFVSAINLTLGTIYGSIEGYYGGAIDITMERISDILASVPFIVVATLFQMHLAEKVGVLPSLLFAFVLTGWVGMASRVRMQFYRFKGQEYILAARTLGAKDSRLMFKHILPNSIGTIITGAVLSIPGVIFSESMLSYLGIVNLETSSSLTSVGTMLSQGQGYLYTHPHIILFPALFIALLEISFNLFGNGLRDAFNPSLRGSEE